MPLKAMMNKLSVGALACAAALQVNAQNVQRWIHPGFAQLDSSLYEDETQYPNTLANSDVFQFFFEDVNNLGIDPSGNGQRSLANRVAILKKHGIRISVEVVAPNPIDGNYALVPAC